MNLQEYENKLRELTPEERGKFNAGFGGERTEIDQRVRDFVDHPEHERRICQLLGLKTEAEKMTDAAINASKAAMQSATAAKLACLIAFIATVASIIVLLKGCSPGDSKGRDTVKSSAVTKNSFNLQCLIGSNSGAILSESGLLGVNNGSRKSRKTKGVRYFGPAEFML